MGAVWPRGAIPGPHVCYGWGMEIIDKLRAEVMRDACLGSRFEDMLEDDRTFVDSEVGRLARQRDISLV